MEILSNNGAIIFKLSFPSSSLGRDNGYNYFIFSILVFADDQLIILPSKAGASEGGNDVMNVCNSQCPKCLC